MGENLISSKELFGKLTQILRDNCKEENNTQINDSIWESAYGKAQVENGTIVISCEDVLEQAVNSTGITLNDEQREVALEILNAVADGDNQFDSIDDLLEISEENYNTIANKYSFDTKSETESSATSLALQSETVNLTSDNDSVTPTPENSPYNTGGETIYSENGITFRKVVNSDGSVEYWQDVENAAGKATYRINIAADGTATRTLFNSNGEELDGERAIYDRDIEILNSLGVNVKAKETTTGGTQTVGNENTPAGASPDNTGVVGKEDFPTPQAEGNDKEDEGEEEPSEPEKDIKDSVKKDDDGTITVMRNGTKYIITYDNGEIYKLNCYDENGRKEYKDNKEIIEQLISMCNPKIDENTDFDPEVLKLLHENLNLPKYIQSHMSFGTETKYLQKYAATLTDNDALKESCALDEDKIVNKKTDEIADNITYLEINGYTADRVTSAVLTALYNNEIDQEEAMYLLGKIAMSRSKSSLSPARFVSMFRSMSSKDQEKYCDLFFNLLENSN